MSAAERDGLFRGSNTDADDPGEWTGSDPAIVGATLRRLRARLEAENDRLPVLHRLGYADGDGRGEGGWASLHVPPRSLIAGQKPDGPMARLEGCHGDADHRMELQRFRVWIDPVQSSRHEAREAKRLAKILAKLDIRPGQAYGISMGCVPRFPLEEEPDGWIPARPVVEVLGRRIKVQSIDKLALIGPDPGTAIACAERAVAGRRRRAPALLASLVRPVRNPRPPRCRCD